MENFLTVEKMNDRLSHKHLVESNDQQKYARLAHSSYYCDDQEYVQIALFSHMNELS